MIPGFEPDEQLRVWGTVAFWGLGGLWFGTLTNRYIRMFTSTGYFWSLGNALIVTGITSAFFEGVFPYIKTSHLDPMTMEKIWSYLFVVPIGLILVLGTSFLGISFSIRSIFQKLVEYTIILGLLELAVDQIWQTTLLKISWWFPEMSPPLGYDWLFTFVLMGIVMMPTYFLRNLRTIPEGTLGPGAVMLDGSTDDFKLKLGNDFSVKYVVPRNWKIEREERDEYNYNLRIQPIPKKLTSFLQVTIYKFTEDTVSEQDRLRRLTLLAIAGRNGEIQKEMFLSWNGVLVHEVYYQTVFYEYMLHYVIHSYEVYVLWLSRDPLAFRNIILEVQEFTKTLQV